MVKRNLYLFISAVIAVFACALPAFADIYTFSGGSGGGGGSGVVGNGNAGQLAYYQATGTTVIGDINATVAAGALTLGQAGSVAGSVILSGSTSGTATIRVAAAAGTSTVFQLPVNNGSSGQFLQTDGSGNTTWVTVSGSGTVTQVTSGNITGFATVSVATNTTTPAISYALTAAGAHQVWGSSAGGTPGYFQEGFADISGVASTGQLPSSIVYGAQSGGAGTFVQSFNSSGVAVFGTPAGAVTSVSAADATLTVSPTTGAVLVSIPSNVALPGAPTTTTAALGDTSTKISTTQYVQTSLTTLNPVESVDAATAAVLPNSPTYANGTAGVGATLTAGSNTTLTVDGFTGSAVGQYFLVKNQATSANNGLYKLTQVGSGAAPWILTRAANFNAAGNINHGGPLFAINGTANAQTTWGLSTSGVVTVGSDPITFFQLGVNPSTIQTVTLPTGDIWIGVANVATAVAVSGDVTINTSGVTAIGANKVTNAMIRQSGALSVIGNSASSTANVADITATAGGQLFGSNAGGAALSFSATPQLGVAGTTGGSLTLAGLTSGTVILQTASVAGTSTVFQLPATNGSSGQFLQTNGSGVTSWQTASGSGTVNAGTAGQVTYYATSSTTVSGNTNMNISAGALTLGISSSSAGSLILEGGTSGACTIQVPGVAGATTFQLPANNGSSGQFLQTNGSGVTSWQTASGSGTVNSGTAGQGTYYASTGTAVSGNPNESWSTGTVTIGQASTVAGAIVLEGATSGAVTVNVPAAAGSTTFTLPGSNGSAGQTLQTNGSGVTSWTNTSITQSAGDATTNIATTAFVATAVNNAIAGVNPAISVTAATTGVLPNTPTYSNGASGIGATLTAGSNTTLTVDGVTFSALTQSVLVKNQASAFQNGIYNVTQVGSGILPWILTRRLDYDTPSDINDTGAIPVVSGTANADTSWLLTSHVTTVGTDSLTYAQFTLNPSTIATINGTPVANQIAVWSSASAVGGSANVTASSGTLTLGQSATAGAVVFNGATSGTVTMGVPAVAGTTTFTLPGSNGATNAANAYFQQLQTDGSGVTSWARQPVILGPLMSNGMQQPNPVSYAHIIAASVTELTTTSIAQYAAIGGDGNVWYGSNGATTKIGQVTPTGTVTEFTTTSNPTYVCAGPDLLTWYATTTTKIGKVTTAGSVTEYTTATSTNGGGITNGPDGNIWYCTNTAKKIGKISTTGTGNTEYTTTSNCTVPCVGADGRIWYATGTTKIGAVTTAGVVTEYTTTSNCTGVAPGADGSVWYSTGTTKIGKVTPAGTATEYTTTSNCTGVAPGPNNQMWYITGTTKIGHINVLGLNMAEMNTTSTTGSELSVGADGSVWYGSTTTKIGYVPIAIATNNITLESKGTALTSSGSFVLNGTTSGSVTFGPPAVAGSTTFTLPGTNGTSGQFLQTNGSGVTVWATASGGGGLSDGGTVTTNTNLATNTRYSADASGGNITLTLPTPTGNAATQIDVFIASTAGAHTVTFNTTSGVIKSAASISSGSIIDGNTGNYYIFIGDGANYILKNLFVGIGGGSNGTGNIVGGAQPSIDNYRLSLTTAVPVTTSNVTAATTVYLTPYTGNHISLLSTDGATWLDDTPGEISVAVPSTLFDVIDMFAVDSSGNGTVTLETNSWSSSQVTGSITGATAANPCVLTATNTLSVGDYVGVAGITGSLGTTAANGLNGKVCRVSAVSGSTITLEGMNTTGLTYTSGGTFYKVPVTRATALGQVNSIYVKATSSTANKQRRYVGTIMTTGTSGQTEDSNSRRLCWNYYNRRPGTMFAVDPANTYSVNTGSPTPIAANNNTADGVQRCSFITGVQEDSMSALRIMDEQLTSGNNGFGMTLDAITTSYPASLFFGINDNGAHGAPQSASVSLYPSAGYHFLQNVDAASAAATVIATSSSGYIISGTSLQLTR